jgi:membrane protease YdiL (CAAX protease family)
LLADGGAGRLLFTAVVVGLGEEYLYRGLLLALALRTGFHRLGFLALSVSFAAWHLPDAWGDLGQVIIVVTVTFLAAHVVLYPLRLRSRTLAGPVLLHTAVNASILLL